MDVASELRDTAESQRDFAFYTSYLSVFIPALQTILGEEKTIAFGRESFDHVSQVCLQPMYIDTDSDTVTRS